MSEERCQYCETPIPEGECSCDASRLEAAESALTEALDALDHIASDVVENENFWMKADARKAAARIRSQIEGSNDG